MTAPWRVLPLLLGLALVAPALAAMEDASEAVRVSVQRQGERIEVAAEFRVPVNVRAAWEVLTDFGHMSRFLPGLKESQILSRAGNRLTVLQKGESALLPVEYESLRAVELSPYEAIRSHTLKGSLGQVEGVTRLLPDGHAGTLVRYTASVHPDSGLAFLLPTGLMRDELKTQFQHLREEMLRRAGPPLGQAAPVRNGV
jgi:carbon monoxide dehydrogenase subunit G